MALPAFALERREVALPGGVVLTVRGLTRGEFVARPDLADDGTNLAELEVYMLALGTETPLEDARTWYHTAPAAVVGLVVEAIYAASGVQVAQGKDGGGA